MEFKVEKNIEMPNKLDNKTKYPWREMEIGDSFLINTVYSKGNKIKAYNAAQSFCRISKDCKKWKFAVRKTEKNEIRIWRIK